MEHNKNDPNSPSAPLLDQQYWDTQYLHNTTGWDLKEVSPPIQSFIDQWPDKDVAVLIPGCGNAYEAAYLLEKGFTNITVVDIAPTLIAELQKRFAGNNNITILEGDFFEMDGTYDLIIEQTFFCALPPVNRIAYVQKMQALLNPKGWLVGLLFNRSFDQNPPFGGSEKEYRALFGNLFHLQKMEITEQSVLPRKNSELWFECCKK